SSPACRVSCRSLHSSPTRRSSDLTMVTALQPGEIVREVIVPVEAANTGASYQKMVQPASGFAIVGAAARVRKSGGKVTFVRVGKIGRATSELQSPDHLVCRLLLEK